MPNPRSTTVSADWVLPIGQPPIRGGHVAIENGRIRAVGAGRQGIDRGRVVLLPALVNAHTHLELSYLHNRVPPAWRFVDWVQALLALRRATPSPADPTIADAAAAAFVQAVATGTGVFADVSNTLATPLLAEQQSAVGVVFLELLGFKGADAAARLADAEQLHRTITRRHASHHGPPIRISLAPHAPYSVSPALFAAIRGWLDREGDALSTLHLAESPEEVELLALGTGPWRAALEAMGVWDAAWVPPGVSPVEYAARLGFLRPSVLVVHAVQCTAPDIQRLASSGATVVVCPRSNEHVGVGHPPLDALYKAGVRVAIGTDSLASAASLNMFDEMAAVRAVARGTPAARILESATRTGATALGLGAQHGALAVGMGPGIIAVDLPDGVDDVEEYLVSGVPPDGVSWVWNPLRGAAMP